MTSVGVNASRRVVVQSGPDEGGWLSLVNENVRPYCYVKMSSLS